LNIFIFSIFCLISGILSILILLLAWFFGEQIIQSEKNAVYECGFSPLGDARQPFEVSFFLVALIFVIFDVEISLLFPWILLVNYIHHLLEFFTLLSFLIFLAVGLIIEWYRGGLEWIQVQ